MSDLQSKYALNDKQVKACERIERALKNARDLGVSIYAKSDSLIGMNSKAFQDKVVCPLHSVVEKADYDTDFFYKSQYLP